MKRILVVALLAATFLGRIAAAEKPTIAIIATGGTIAGTAESSTKAGYSPAQIAVEALISSVPAINDIANIIPIQLCNISSQAMNNEVWLALARKVDSLFTSGSCRGVVVTHGTDTMEETAYFLNLTIKHPYPVVLTGSMRPSTSLSADGPMNLYNAVSLAASEEAHRKGVMIVMDDYILSADDAIKTHSTNPYAFESPNFGPLGIMRGGKPTFFREPMACHTEKTEFPICRITDLPKVDIVYSYANADETALNAFVEHGSKGIVIAGVGHANFTPAIGKAAEEAVNKGVAIVRSTRVIKGGATTELEEPFEGEIASYYKSPQKARILLMISLTKTNDPAEIQEIFKRY